MPKRRDRYGRFKGKGGIKAYKSNLKGKKRSTTKRSAPKRKAIKRTPPGQVAAKKKGMSKKKKVAIAAGVGAAALLMRNAHREDQLHKRLIGRSAGAKKSTGTMIGVVGAGAYAISKAKGRSGKKKSKKKAK